MWQKAEIYASPKKFINLIFHFYKKKHFNDEDLLADLADDRGHSVLIVMI